MNIFNAEINDVFTVEELLKSLGFVDVTGVQIMNGSKVHKTVGFSGQKFRCRWGRRGCYTAVVNNEGDVFLRYGNDDVTKGAVFSKIIKEFGCSEDLESMIISSCTPAQGQQFDTEQLMDRIFHHKILT